MASVANMIKKHYMKGVMFVVFALLISWIFGVAFKTIFFILFFIVLGSISTFYYNYFVAPIHFELVKLGTILVGAAFGLVEGIVVGILATIIGKILIGRVDEKILISLLSISILAVVAAFISPSSIVTVGIILVIIYNAVNFTLVMLSGGDLAWNLPYHGSNIVINYILFTKIAEPIYSVMI